MKQETVAKMMLVVAWVVIVYAIIWATAPYEGLNAPARILLDILAWPMGDGLPNWNAQLAWMSSIGAGLLMALGVIFLGVIYPAIKAGDTRVVRVTIMAMLAWFVIDSAGSIAAGYSANAVINLITLLPIIIPLVLALKCK